MGLGDGWKREHWMSSFWIQVFNETDEKDSNNHKQQIVRAKTVSEKRILYAQSEELLLVTRTNKILHAQPEQLKY